MVMKYGDVLETEDMLGMWFWVFDISCNLYGGFVREDDDGLFIEDRGKTIYLDGKRVLLTFSTRHYEKFPMDC
jgi:hypothetical protein